MSEEDEGYYCSCGRFIVDSFCEECQAADELEACSGTPEHEKELLFDELLALDERIKYKHTPADERKKLLAQASALKLSSELQELVLGWKRRYQERQRQLSELQKQFRAGIYNDILELGTRNGELVQLESSINALEAILS